jgi:UDP:flavonoid glycosyltransferase YjiC (YdhE family)
LVERYVPHALLLPHCDLVVSQGGAGILLGALAHGVPQLVLPQGADQFANGAAVQRAGLGVTLEGEAVTSSAIADATQRLLTEPAFRTAASALRREIEAMPSADHVVASVTAQVARSPIARGGPKWPDRGA